MDRETQHMQAAQAPTGAFSNLMSAKPIQAKIGRNDPCFCGSGLKYKKCHLV
jgi:uncharacterized protein YecA (UPF0149 family)